MSLDGYGMPARAFSSFNFMQSLHEKAYFARPNPYRGMSYYRIAKNLIKGLRFNDFDFGELQDIGNALLKSKKFKARLVKDGFSKHGDRKKAADFISTVMAQAKAAASRETCFCDEAEALGNFVETL